MCVIGAKRERYSISAAIVIAAVVLLCLYGCTKHEADGGIVTDNASPYGTAVTEMLPAYAMSIQSKNALADVGAGHAAVVLEPVAEIALKANPQLLWYPQTLDTVVIAIDRDCTDASVAGWGDLLYTDANISFAKETERYIVSAISFGLEGANFTLNSTAQLLRELYADGRLWDDSAATQISLGGNVAAAIQIGFDSDFVTRIRAGENLEIIVPQEGTLSFSKGILSPWEIAFPENAEEILLAAGLRLTNGRCDGNLYKADYSPAVQADDFTHINRIGEDVTRVLRRFVLPRYRL